MWMALREFGFCLQTMGGPVDLVVRIYGGVGLHVSEYVPQTSIHRTGSPYSYPSHVNTILEGSAGHETPDKHSVGILVVGVLESVLGLV